jgi:signal transduction histidine kinase
MWIFDIFKYKSNKLKAPENKYIIYLLSIIFILGYVFDLIYGNLIISVFIFDIVGLVLSILAFTLFIIDRIEIRMVVKVQVISLLANIILSHFLSPIHMADYTGIFLRNLIILGFLLPIYGIYCGKYHVFQIGFTFLLIYFSTLLHPSNQFLTSSAPMLITCGISYLIGMFYIIDSLEKMQNKQIQLSLKLQEQSDLLIQKNVSLENQKKQIEEQAAGLRQLNTDKDLFISILAHDLKNPFNALLGMSQLLVTNVRSYQIEKIENFAIHLHQMTLNTYNLLDDLLLWTQSQSGKLPYEPQELKLSDLCEEILKTSVPIAHEKGIIIDSFVGNDIKSYADRNMLETILRNLVSNAIKFTNSNGKIAVNAKQTGSNLFISVTDNGIGMSTEIKNKLFDISRMVTTKGTANEGGTGIGLFLCKDFIEKHGGEIWIESEEGKGSVFTFTIPIVNEPNEC